MSKTGAVILIGSENEVTNLPGLDKNNASTTAKGYPQLYFHAFSTGAPSPNLHTLSTVLSVDAVTSTELDTATRGPVSVTEPVLFFTGSTGTVKYCPL